ncbi:major royal jelly family protein [Massilia sp. G4R7]|uniref:Major royal jelly family protein n=1 Tax=Massilia phyllostachyos TaxID=2898585 RepID=A0ABS8Q5J6_9BURK|nr:major royal jelly family protein [Massilia phyllostachyos]MCD2517020.1 major royal jelly family protein [Massilia phyllostachyos]
MRTAAIFLALVSAGAGLFSGAAPAAQGAPEARPEHRRAGAMLQQAAQFEHQVTGVTVSERGRIFVNFPRWTEDAPVSVAEVLKDGSLRPYPDERWNAWRNVRRDELDPAQHWVCVQSVVADGRGSVWVVDPAAPAVDGLVPRGPKLVRIDLATDRVAQVIPFGQDVAIPGSYLNDVRFSNDGKYAYLTDAGQRGALVVVELASGKARRVLDGHPSTQPEKGVVVRTDGLWIGRGGDTLYLTSIEDNAIKARRLSQGPDGALRTVVRDPRLRWPDTFSQGPDGALYVTSSRIQDSAFFNRAAPLALPTQLWRLPQPRD